MAENEKVVIVPKIGELIDKKTGIKYETYNADQKLGQTAENSYVNLEAAVAAIVNHPELKSTVVDLLKDQAIIRERAAVDANFERPEGKKVPTEADIPKELEGKTLGSIQPVPMTPDGKLMPNTVKDGVVTKNGALFMSEMPTKADVIAANVKSDPSLKVDLDAGKPINEELLNAHPKLKTDLAKLEIAQEVLKDPAVRAAEGASNDTNAATDVRALINGKTVSAHAKKDIQEGLKASTELLDRMEHNNPKHFLREFRTHRLEHKLDKMLDAAATTAGVKLDDPVYQHYKEGMHKGIDAGMEAAKALHDKGVKPTNAEITQATPVAAVKKEVVGKTGGS
jgi:hypothetical protein